MTETPKTIEFQARARKINYELVRSLQDVFDLLIGRLDMTNPTERIFKSGISKERDSIMEQVSELVSIAGRDPRDDGKVEVYDRT